MKRDRFSKDENLRPSAAGQSAPVLPEDPAASVAPAGGKNKRVSLSRVLTLLFSAVVIAFGWIVGWSVAYILIVVGVLILGVGLFFAALVGSCVKKQKEHYERSDFYRDFGIPYRMKTADFFAVRAYSGRGAAPDAEWFVTRKPVQICGFKRKGEVCLIANFSDLVFDEFSGEWRCISDKKAKERCEFSKWLALRISALAEELQGLPIKVLVEREQIEEDDLSQRAIPAEVIPVLTCDEVFMKYPAEELIKEAATSEEMLLKLRQIPDSCGSTSVNGDTCVWRMGELTLFLKSLGAGWEIAIYAAVQGKQVRINSLQVLSAFTVPQFVANCGRRGNISVFSSSKIWNPVRYVGSKRGCPYKKPDKQGRRGVYWFAAEEPAQNAPGSSCR